MTCCITANNLIIETLSQLHRYAVTPSHRYLDAQFTLLLRYIVIQLDRFSVTKLHHYSVTPLLS